MLRFAENVRAWLEQDPVWMSITTFKATVPKS
jgi:hypothetical protein